MDEVLSAQCENLSVGSQHQCKSQVLCMREDMEFKGQEPILLFQRTLGFPGLLSDNSLPVTPALGKTFDCKGYPVTPTCIFREDMGIEEPADGVNFHCGKRQNGTIAQVTFAIWKRGCSQRSVARASLPKEPPRRGEPEGSRFQRGDPQLRHALLAAWMRKSRPRSR
ncbi:hypothetical protein STEG23_028363 [Scotinomys teguina]